MTNWLMLNDFAIAGCLLLLGKVIRVHSRLLQRFYLPSAVIAGIIGLALGPSSLDILPWSGSFGSNAGLLTTVLFCSLGLATDIPSPSQVANRAGSLWAFNQIATVSQWMFAALFGLFLATFIWPELNSGFGLVMSSGFMGGHGTSVVVGEIFGDLGWEDALTLCLSFATAGIFIAIILGMLLLQLALKLGLIDNFASFEQMDRYQRRGLIEPEKQQAVMTETMSSLSVDSFAVHLAMVAAVTAFAYLSGEYLSSFHPKVQIPTFVTGFIGGMLVRRIAQLTGSANYLCDKVFNHASGCSTDYLIVFGISSIQVMVLANYLLPMVVLMLGGISFTLFLILWVAPKILGKGWFEKGIFSWGWLTGTVAMGIALLRIVDPKMRSKVLDDYAIAYVPGSITDIFVISLMPLAMVSGYHWLAFAVAASYITVVLGIWRFVLPKQG
ncbi:sodium/glutamate symporter [Aliagarivorans marinus]|uniref:sodium/glutamate symporter n=1 Tax=Aliagarivorans marinus TaxID=561965 RepID=UPI00042214C8|nr:sodium/glutamate symporter [Aliagarivorans marinus]